jgi:hypothetical protein
MSVFRTEPGDVKPTYLTQEEANKVLTIWTESQKGSLDSQSLLTINDVAEAIQVSSEQVIRILSLVRQEQSVGPKVVQKPENLGLISFDAKLGIATAIGIAMISLIKVGESRDWRVVALGMLGAGVTVSLGLLVVRTVYRAIKGQSS